MIHALLIALGGAWLLWHWAYWIFAAIVAGLTVYILWRKGLLVGFRGACLALVLGLLSVDGLIVAGLLRGGTSGEDG